MSKKSVKWYIHYEGEVYANDLYFNMPLNESEVRAYLREFHNTKRLSNNTQIWRA